uniref:Amino acid transporter n=1 Tax=Tetraodon nigroviridis TaxID=99883 RepID=H3DDF3_TETNG
MVLPLIVSSLVTGLSSMDRKVSGKMGKYAVAYYTFTTLIAVFTGIVLVLTIKPGKGSKDSSLGNLRNLDSIQTVDAFLDLIRNMIPNNLVEACFKQYKTVYKKTVPQNLTEALNVTESQKAFSIIAFPPQEELVPVPSYFAGVNALGLVVFSVCLGLVIGSMKQQGQVLQDFFDSLNEAIMRLVSIIIWYTPVGILFLITGKILEMSNLAEMGSQLGMYTASVIVGLVLLVLIVLPLLLDMANQKHPYMLLLITALGPSPITFRCLEDVTSKWCGSVPPVGATLNMDGTFRYEAVAAIFIAQVNGMELNF